MSYSQRYSVECLDEFDFLSKDFADLCRASRVTAFQNPLWLHHLYHFLIPALGKEPAIISIREKKGGRLRLVLPLLRVRYAGLSCIELADLGVNDYNTVIGDGDMIDIFSRDERMRSHVLSELKPFHLLLFRKVLPSCDAFSRILGDAQIGEMDSSSHHVKLWGPYEDWKKEHMSSAFRKELRRKQKKLEQIGPVTFRIMVDPEDIRRAMGILREQRRHRYADDLFALDSYFEFYCRIAIDGAKSGFAQTAVLESGDDVAAVEFGLVQEGCYYFVLAGFDSVNYGKMSPGLIMIDSILEKRLEEGDTLADFTIGDEAYKARYKPIQTRLHHVARTETLLGDIALKAYSQGGAIKKLAKRVAAF